MVDKYKYLTDNSSFIFNSSVQHVGNKQVMWKYMLFRSTLPTSKTTSQVSVLMIEHLVTVSFELWMV